MTDEMKHWMETYKEFVAHLLAKKNKRIQELEDECSGWEKRVETMQKEIDRLNKPSEND